MARSAGDQTLVRAGQFTQVARQAAIILVALSLPRLGLNESVIGSWEALLYAGYLLGFGWLTGLTQGYLVTVRNRPDPVVFGRRVLLLISGISLGVIGLAALFHSWLFALLQFNGPPPGWLFFFGYLLIQWPAQLFEQLLVVERRPRLLAVWGGLSALGFLLTICLPIYLGYDLATAMGWLFGFSLLRAVGLVGLSGTFRGTGRAPGRLRRLSDASDVRHFLTVSWPLILFASLGALTTAFDPWFVNYWYDGDEATFALFRYGTRELPLLAALISGMTVVVLPKLAESRTDGLRLLRASSRRLMHWVFPGLIGLLLTSPWWWTLLFTEAFAGSLPLFHVYIFVVVSRLLFPVTVLTATGHTRLLPVFAGLEFVINVLLSVWLASWFGLIGIVWATVLAYLVDKLCLVAFLRYRTGIGPGQYTDLRWYGGYAVALGLVYWWL